MTPNDHRATLQSQDREDAERWREISRRFDRGRLSSKEQFLQAIRLNPRDAPYTLASIIDRARGEGKSSDAPRNLGLQAGEERSASDSLHCVSVQV